MKNLSLIAFALLFAVSAAADIPADYVWDSMSRDSSQSMPVGGGDIGLNVWAEDGDVLFYISRSGAYDENGALLKQGRVRIHIPGCPVKPFSQRLRLVDGYCELALGDSKVVIWADVYRPVVHVEIEGRKAVKPRVSYENWRYADRPYRKGEGQQGSWKWTSPKKNVRTSRDSIFPGQCDVTFFHHNPDSTVFDVTVAREGMDSVKHKLWNPLSRLASGGRLRGDNLRYVGTSDGVYDGTDYRSWNFESVRPSKKHHFSVALHICRADKMAEWKAGVDSVERTVDLRHNRDASRKWWNGYWERSYISAPVSADTVVARMARNYTLFRYMLGCNAFRSEEHTSELQSQR